MNLTLAGLFILGVCAGSLANLAAYRLAWCPRPISPWSTADPQAPPRRPVDRAPVLGWLGLKREAALHGAGFWIRPMLVELLMGLAFAGLYWWEIGRTGLLPPHVLRPLPETIMTVLHVQYAVHLVLLWLMLVGSLIDLDEKIIPDTITVPGTLLGLMLAAVYPQSLLPIVVGGSGGVALLDFLHLASPYGWPPVLVGFPLVLPLVVGLACWWLWCFALMPRTWYTRHGWGRAIRLSWARLRREPATRRILLVGLLGSVAAMGCWRLGGVHWAGLLSALVGMAAAGGLVWTVRILGTYILRREAMGFGDVTLMAMLGTFLGWQPSLILFFIAPFFALVVGLVVLVVHRQTIIPYGPFLCMAALVILVRWPSFWAWGEGVFALGWIVPLMVVFCMALIPLLLGIWQLVLGLFRA